MKFDFRTKQHDRWSDELTPQGVLDMALRGSREQWWELYHAARTSPDLRALLRCLRAQADPDLAPGTRLWQTVLARMEAASNHQP